MNGIERRLTANVAAMVESVRFKWVRDALPRNR
jgi:hypothetical protein